MNNNNNNGKKRRKKKSAVLFSLFYFFFPLSSVALLSREREREKKKRKSTNNPSFSVIYPFLFLAETTLFSSFSFCGRCNTVLFFFFLCVCVCTCSTLFPFFRVLLRILCKVGTEDVLSRWLLKEGGEVFIAVC